MMNRIGRRDGTRGFSLVELLVVVGIVALLVGLVVPSLTRARHTAQDAVGTANLKSVSTVLLDRTYRERGDFLNPFIDRRVIDATGRTRQEAVDGTYGELNAGDRYRYETYSAFWFNEMAAHEGDASLTPEMFVSPADGDAVTWLRNDRAAGSPPMDSAGSFYYAANFYKHQEGFTFETYGGNCCGGYFPIMRQNQECCTLNTCCKPTASPGRTSLEMVSFPLAKVLVFERADFSKPSRAFTDQSGENKNDNLSPAWNNPQAEPKVATVDGSVTTASMGDLFAAALAGTESRDRDLVPVDLLLAPDRVRPNGGVSTFDGLYPYFFSATRWGVRGRDIIR